ncbi:hypothetical protein GF337_00230 [candidate division KSB1 bacterium]|nr:hypothetical protein [candidate division KSB1 bacterium]
MKGLISNIFIIVCAGILLNSFASDQKKKNVVIIPKGQSRSFMLTNFNSTFYFAETSSKNTSSFQGFNVQTHEFLEDYVLEVKGRPISRSNAEIYLYPNKLVRKYSDIPLEEEVSLSDSLPVLVVKLTSTEKLPLAVSPQISEDGTSKNFINHWKEDENVLFIAKRSHTARKEEDDYPVWTGIYVYPGASFTGSNASGSNVRMVNREGFIPGKLTFELDGTAYVFVVVGDDKNDVLEKRKIVLKQFNIFLEKSGKKIEGVRRT